MLCHGCHLQMGQGAHNGSASGKNQCTLPHSLSCPGGIVEDNSWRACPTGYQFHGQVVPESGFTTTMNMSDFSQLHSTPNVSAGVRLHPSLNIVPRSISLSQEGSSALAMSSLADSLPNLAPPVHVTQSQSFTPFPEYSTPATQSLPVTAGSCTPVTSSVPAFSSSQSGILTSVSTCSTSGGGLMATTAGVVTNQPVVDQHMQEQVAALRAANQIVTSAGSHDTVPLDIGALRALPSMQHTVETQLQQLRSLIPALQAARTASVASEQLPSYPAGCVQQQGSVQQQVQSTAAGLPQPHIPPFQAGGAPTQPLQVQRSFPPQPFSIPVVPQPRQQLASATNQAQPMFAQGVPTYLPSQVSTRPPLYGGTPGAQQQQGVLGDAWNQGLHQLQGVQPGSQPNVNFAPHLGQQVLQPGVNPAKAPIYTAPQNGAGINHLVPNDIYQGHPHIGLQHALQLQQPQVSYHVQSGQHIRPQQPAQQPVQPHQLPHSLQQQVQPPQLPYPDTPVNQSEQPQYKLEYRCSPTSGKVFHVYVPVRSPLTPVTYEWRCDPLTGETYQVPVRMPSNPTPRSRGQPQFLTQAGAQPPLLGSLQNPDQQLHLVAHPWSLQPQPAHQASDQVQQHGQGSLQPAQLPEASEKIKGISELCGGGATKKSKVIDFSRKCPVRWAKLAKPDNVNLPLYAYGAVTELEAALSGRGEPISHEVLLSKIRHLKNTFEVCCLNSSATDFCSYGWIIARDYALKVEEEVDQKFVSWHDMPPGIRTQTLLLSQMEHPRASIKKKAEDTTTSKKDYCTTFNTCTTEMKCNYEVTNPGRTCQKKHDCSWCRANLHQSYKHQEWKCQKKVAAAQ